ncbi:hypothetical protein VC83_01616 [Pseudogymnoascus destructans]|uniref:Bud22 domain-containing protein n=2 Tax=Pseudogymnoascus destructans TaxID=655981 RepID=L8G5L1_PSED2|nr:uncharacterized protein VC83_01616 [Pseudogymnoascus destructans]ELR08089.1 hypothetical protein GMDG_02916 [Pseudogymnoascus destructans 20631-21]OAF62086.1 hypothetical protein VC83_01616 [Pseudogymnoascus destructans]
MLKRKREGNARGPGGGGAEGMGQRRGEVEEKLVHGKKMLNRALKTAKGFEWQKLVKRITNAKAEDAAGQVVRLERELKVLKDLEMQALADAHVHKTLLKSKTIAESGLLPDYVKPPVRKTGSEEDILAMDNVTARLYNTKPVKENMTHIMTSIYAVTGIPNPANKPKLKGEEAKEPPAKKMKRDDKDAATRRNTEKLVADKKEKKEVEPTWEGFDSGSESDGESIDFSKYEGRLGGSSDDDSSSDSAEELKRPAKPVKRTIKSRGISVSVSGSDDEGEPEEWLESDEEEDSDEDDDDNVIERSHSPPTREKKKQREPPKPLKPGSQFLPTLMGGYWSGSEEEATDVEDEVAPAPRKNRPGQQARRAIWEKKFGKGANHVKNAPPPKEKDVVWDAKLGAVSSEGSGRGRGRAGFTRNRSQVTGENASELGPRKPRGLGKKDDVGVLHPSWQAAKKAKEEKKAAKFEGKKVVF